MMASNITDDELRTAERVLDAFWEVDRENETEGLIDHKETDVIQMAVLLKAFKIFKERNEIRSDLFREFGYEDSALHLRSKAARVALCLRGDLDVTAGDVLDDALDAVNYAVFFIRNTLGR